MYNLFIQKGNGTVFVFSLFLILLFTMKKLIAPALGLLAVFGVFAIDTHSLVFAQGAINSPMIDTQDNAQNVAQSTTYGGSFREALRTIVNYILFFLGIVATIMVIYGGFLYITGGSGEGNEKAKKILMYAAIGIVVVLISFALVNTLLGAGQNTGQGAQ